LQKTVRLFKRLTLCSGHRCGRWESSSWGRKSKLKTVYEEAARCGQYYVNQRWLGGMLTNFSTIKQSIERLNQIEPYSINRKRQTSRKRNWST
jgi:small subunit ribosomal protein S2